MPGTAITSKVRGLAASHANELNAEQEDKNLLRRPRICRRRFVHLRFIGAKLCHVCFEGFRRFAAEMPYLPPSANTIEEPRPGDAGAWAWSPNSRGQYDLFPTGGC